jgi:hypothetical protein
MCRPHQQERAVIRLVGNTQRRDVSRKAEDGCRNFHRTADREEAGLPVRRTDRKLGNPASQKSERELAIARRLCPDVGAWRWMRQIERWFRGEL